MSTTKERSTVIERYTKPEMGHIWTEYNEWDTMKQVEILASEAQAELGNIPKEAAKEIREKAAFSVDRIHEIEAETHHDIAAFVSTLSENIGEAGKYVHLGLTSTDVKDTALGYMLKQASDILIKDPDVLIMDEPTNGIDPEGMHELMALIRELADKDGKTILISSHQLHQIQQICDRVGIFVKGKLVACGEIGELGKQLEQESGFRLEVGAEPGGNALAEALKGVPGVSSVEENGETFLVQSATDVSDAVAQALLAQKFHLTYLRQCGSDLDEIYSRYFVKAGEQHEGSRGGSIFRHLRSEAKA